MCHVTCHGKLTTAVAMGVWPQMRGMSRLTHDQELGQPDGGDGQDQAGGASEAPHDDDLDDRREQDDRGTSPVASPRK